MHTSKSFEHGLKPIFLSLVLLIVIMSVMKRSPFTGDISPFIQNDNSKFAHV